MSTLPVVSILQQKQGRRSSKSTLQVRTRQPDQARTTVNFNKRLSVIPPQARANNATFVNFADKTPSSLTPLRMRTRRDSTKQSKSALQSYQPRIQTSKDLAINQNPSSSPEGQLQQYSLPTQQSSTGQRGGQHSVQSNTNNGLLIEQSIFSKPRVSKIVKPKQSTLQKQGTMTFLTSVMGGWYNNANSANQQNKLINTTNQMFPFAKSTALEDHFKRICREPKSSHVIRCKLSKPKFFQFLNRSFVTLQNTKPGGKSFIAEKLSTAFDFTLAMDYNNYFDQVEALINKEPSNLVKLAFQIYDFNDDGFIDEFDLYCVMKLIDFQLYKDHLKRKKHPFLNMTDKHKTFLKGLLPRDEVDLFLDRGDQQATGRKVPLPMTPLEEGITNDLKSLSLFLTKKQQAFEFSRFNKESISSRMSQLEKRLQEQNQSRMQNYLQKKKRNFVLKKGLTKDQARDRVNELIDGLKQETKMTLTLKDSHEQIQMDQKMRDFYEGKHLISDSREDLKRQLELEKQRKHDEKIRKRKLREDRLLLKRLMDPDADVSEEESSSEESEEEDGQKHVEQTEHSKKHPYHHVFGKAVSQLIINKQRAKTQLYTANPRETGCQPSGPSGNTSPGMPRLERRMSIAKNIGPSPALKQQRISFEEFTSMIKWEQLIPEVCLSFVGQLTDQDPRVGIKERKALNWKHDPRSREYDDEDLE